MDPWNGQQPIGVDGSPLQIRGCVQITLKIAEVKFNGPFIVVNNLTAEGILGLDFLKAHHCNIDIPNNSISFFQKNLKVPPQTKSQHSSSKQFTYLHDPRCEKEVLAHSQIPCSSNQPWLLEHKPSKLNSVVIARAIVSPINGTFPVRLVNLGDLTVTLYKNRQEV